MDEVTATTRTPSGRLLRELEAQLAAADDALRGRAPDLDAARTAVARAQDALAALLAERTAAARPEGTAPGPVLVRRRELAPAAASAREARDFVQQTCRDWSVPGTVVTAATDIVSELVANAVALPASQVVLALERTPGTLTVRVWDDGPGLPRLVAYLPGRSERGLGLRLVKQLSRRWGVTADGAGKWVWAHVALPGEHAGPAPATR